MAALTHEPIAQRRGLRAATLAALWALAWLLALATFALTNDHFGRLSPARQIVQYGELPFRDFLDPGYFLTELASAAMLAAAGDNLLGEWVLTSLFIATGTLLVLLLTERLTLSRAAAVAAAAIAILTLPRAYDYDKVLFYPLGLWACWNWIDHDSRRSLWMLAGVTAAGALFRYDTGVYLACAALPAIAIVHAGRWPIVLRRAGALLGAVICLCLPALALLQLNGGLVAAADQVLTYGRRETMRTRLDAPPHLTLGRWAGITDIEQLNDPILVRWAPSVDEAARQAVEARFRLRQATPTGPARDRTWSYRLADPSADNLRALIRDPRVEDTHGVDRAASVLQAESWLQRAGRRAPALRWRLFPGAWTYANATAVLFHLLRWLPLVAAIVLVANLTSSGSRLQLARLSSLIVVCVLLNVFILRDPVPARIGGMAGPAAVLGAWLISRAWHGWAGPARRALRVAVVLLLALTVWSVSVTAEWSRRLTGETLRPSYLGELASILAASPPGPRALPSVQLAGLVEYLRTCTRPDDRVLVTWFAPELYFFARRGFAGSTAVFGGHWSEPRFEGRLVQAMAAHPVPVVIAESNRLDSMREDYPALARYLDDHFVNAGRSDFGNRDVDDGHYTVLAARDRASIGTDPGSGMPCFAGP